MYQTTSNLSQKINQKVFEGAERRIALANKKTLRPGELQEMAVGKGSYTHQAEATAEYVISLIPGCEDVHVHFDMNEREFVITGTPYGTTSEWGSDPANEPMNGIEEGMIVAAQFILNNL